MSVFPYASEQRNRLARLMVYKWKGVSDKQIRKKIIWRYENNPFDIPALIFLAAQEDDVIGFRGFIPQMFALGHRRLQVFIPADAVVHPSYRRRGIFSALNQKVLSHLQERKTKQGFILNLTSNSLSRPGNLKQGWQQAAGSRTINYRVSFANYFSFVFPHKKLPFSSVYYTPEKENIRFHFSEEIRPRELSLCWEKYHPHNKLTIMRNEAYFSWRYAAPGAKYVFLYAKKEEDTVGYLVLRKAKKSKYVLEEYQADNISLLRQMTECAQKELGITVLKTAALSQHQQNMLLEMGFLRPTGLMGKLFKTKQFPVLLRPLVMEPGEEDFFFGDLDARNMENWLLFQADAY